LQDIQLLGTPQQVTAMINYCRAHSDSGGANITEVLGSLREDLRHELGLTGNVESSLVFRFERDT